MSKKLFRWIRYLLMFLAIAWALTACASTPEKVAAAKATEAAALATIAAVKAAKETATPLPLPSLIPSSTKSPTVSPSPTPAKPVIWLITHYGEEFQASSLVLEMPNSHLNDPGYSIPTASGVEISLDYVKQVEFGEPEEGWYSNPFTGTWPVRITLLDGTTLEENVGYKADYGIAVYGTTEMGELEIPLEDVWKIVLERESAPQSVPTSPPSSRTIVNVVTRYGASIMVSNPYFYTRCSRESFPFVYCCYGDRVDSIPVEGLNVDLTKVKKAEFGDLPEYGIQIPVRITAVDGKTYDYTIRPSEECGQRPWVLSGMAALGWFEIPINAVKWITSP